MGPLNGSNKGAIAEIVLGGCGCKVESHCSNVLFPFLFQESSHILWDKVARVDVVDLRFKN